MRIFTIAVALEIIGIALVGAGLGYEIALGAHFGFVLITGGSVVTAIGGVLFGKFFKLHKKR